jgi:multidrug efflux pump subunit AcrB
MKDDYLPQIQQIKGVAEITFLGGEEREIQVKVNQDKLKLYKISMFRLLMRLIVRAWTYLQVKCKPKKKTIQFG